MAASRILALRAAIASAALLGAASAANAQSVWNNAAADGLWNTAGNWSTSDVPDAAGEDAVFSGTGVGSINLNNGGAGFTLNSAVFSAGGYTLADSVDANDKLNVATNVSFNVGTNEVVGGVLGNSNIRLGGTAATLRLTPQAVNVSGLWASRYSAPSSNTIANITFSGATGAYTVPADKGFTGAAGVLADTPTATFQQNGAISFSTGAAPGGTGDNFAVAYSGFLVPDVSGTWTIRASGNTDGDIDDDGSFYLDLNNNGIFEASEGVVTGTNANLALSLTANEKYRIAIGYRDGSGNEGFSARVQAPGGSMTVINPSTSPLFQRLQTAGAVSSGSVDIAENGTIEASQGAAVYEPVWTYGSLNVAAGKTFTKSGTGRLKFTGTSAGDGNIIINAGALEVTLNDGLGTTVGGTVVNSSGRLVVSAVYTTAEPLTLNGSGTANNGALSTEAVATFAGPITLGSASMIASMTSGQQLTIRGGINTGGAELRLGGAGNIRIETGAIVGGSLRKTDAGTATLAIANAYTGATTVEGGILQLGVSSTLPNTSGISVASGATLQVSTGNALASTNTVTLASGSRLLASSTTGVSANVTIPNGAIIDSAAANGLTHATAVITREPAAIIRVSNSTGLNGGQLLASNITSGAIVQLNADNIANLNSIGQGVLLEVFGTTRTETASANFDITGKTLTQDNGSRLVGNGTNAIVFGAAGTTIAATSAQTLEFDEQINAPGNPVTFGSLTSLNGLTKAGTVRFDSTLDIGTGTIVAGTVRLNQGVVFPAASTLEASGGGVEIYDGAEGDANDVFGTIRLSGGRSVVLRVDEVDTLVVTPKMNLLTGRIEVLDSNAANLLRAERDGDDDINGYAYFSNVVLSDGARVNIDQNQDQKAIVSASVPAGIARLHHADTDGNRDYLGNLSGAGQINITGTVDINLIGAVTTRINVGGAAGAGLLDLAATDSFTSTTFGTGWSIANGTLAIGTGGDVDVEVSGTIGTLLFNGGAINYEGASTLTVANRLGGSGTLPIAKIALGPSAKIAPGDSTGNLTLTGNLPMTSDQVLEFELDATNATIGAANDLLTVTGNLTLDGTLNVLVQNGTTLANGNTYRLINYTGALTDLGLEKGSIPLAGGLAANIDTSVNGQVNLVVVPEPSAVAAAAVAMVGLLGRRRRR